MALGDAVAEIGDHGGGGAPTRIDALEAEITTLAALIGAATYRLLVLIEEFDRRAGWCGDGLCSCAHWLNWKCGIGMVAAREKVRVARALPAVPRIAEAMRVGKLSYSKVRALTRIAGPHNESALLSIAENPTASHVEKTVRLYRRTDPERDKKRAVGQQDDRGLSCYWGDDGSLVIKGRLPPEQGALVIKALEAADGVLRTDERSAGAEQGDSAEACPVTEERGYRQRQADALALMAETLLARGAEGLPAGERHLVQVHVDLEALTSASASAETACVEACEARCHVADGPTLAHDVARRLACDGGVLAVFEDGAGKTLDVGRKTRAIPPALRRALENRDHGCRFPGCTCTRFVDAHHIDHWANGGATKLENLALNGAKQLSVSACHWAAQIAFTGVAFVGRYNTRDWLVEFCKGADRTISPEQLAVGLAREASERMASVTSGARRLTLVVAAAQDDSCRLFIVSNWECPRRAPRDAPQDSFEWFEQDLKVPTFLVHGCRAVVPPSARGSVIRLLKESEHPKRIREMLATINRYAAGEEQWKHVISSECWVNALLSDGQSKGTNVGGIAGVPPDVRLGIGDVMKQLHGLNLPGLPKARERWVIRERGEYRGPTTPQPRPVGEERSIPFSSGSASRNIGPSDARPHATLTISGIRGLIGVRKNAVALQQLATVRLELSDTRSSLPPYSLSGLTLPNAPTVDGAVPRRWTYPSCVRWDGASLEVTFLTSSMAFRRANHDHALPHLGHEEELTMAAPHKELTLVVTHAGPSVEVPIVGRFQLRDFPERRLKVPN